MATLNSINNQCDQFEAESITVDPGASGDSYTQFDLATVNKWRMGVDDDAADAFKISEGTALGTNDTFIMTAAGECTLPLQSAFLATLNAEANATGDGTVHEYGSITATTQVFDQNSDYSPGDGAGTGNSFTAPITGRYLLVHSVRYSVTATTGADYTTTRILTSNRNYDGFQIPTRNIVTNLFGEDGDLAHSYEVIADMDASDTAEFALRLSDGTKVDDIVSGFISGCLLA